MLRYRLAKVIMRRVDQIHFTGPIKILLAVGKHLIEVGLRQSIQWFFLLAAIHHLPFRIHDHFGLNRLAWLNQQVWAKLKAVVKSMLHKGISGSLWFNCKVRREFVGKGLCNKGFKYRFHWEQEGYRFGVSPQGTWAHSSQDQLCPSHWLAVMRHTTLNA